MKKFKVTVRRRWSEFGKVVVVAANTVAAAEIARDLLSTEDDSIEWGDMEPDEDEIETVTKLNRR